MAEPCKWLRHVGDGAVSLAKDSRSRWRSETISAERAGDPASATLPATAGTALAVLSAVLDRDGQQRSATQVRGQALADADHLALLHVIWTAETRLGRRPGLQYRPAGHRRRPGQPRPGQARTVVVQAGPFAEDTIETVHYTACPAPPASG
jgi:hypothetical protein